MTTRRHQVLQEALRQLQQGGSAAEAGQRQLFDLLWRPFVQLAQRYGQPPAIAQELASDALYKVLTRYEQVRDGQAFEKWAFVVMHRTLVSHLRATAQEASYEATADEDTWLLLQETTAHPGNSDSILALCLQGQFEHFSEQHPEKAYWLQYWITESPDIENFATVQGRTPAASKEYLFQCRKALKTFLRHCLEHEK